MLCVRVPDVVSVYSGPGRDSCYKRESAARVRSREYIESHPSAVICGEVQRCQDTEYSLSVYLKQVFLLCQSERIPIRNIRVFLEKNAKENLKTGMVIQVGGELERVSAPRNPGEFDSQQYYACQGIYYFLKNGIIQKKGRNYSKYGQFLTELRGRIGEILLENSGRRMRESTRRCCWEKKAVWMRR